MQCLLCDQKGAHFVENHFDCQQCGLLFKDPATFPNSEVEGSRYLFHQYNIDDEKKRKGHGDFLSKLIRPLLPFIDQNSKILDFGSGPTPLMHYLLKDHGFHCEFWDPFFFPEKERLKISDAIIVSEVAEHFHSPLASFNKINSLLRPNGVIAIMTSFFKEGYDYNQWWYKNDPTHVVFYREKTLQFISEKFNYDILFNDQQSIVIFKKNGGPL